MNYEVDGTWICVLGLRKHGKLLEDGASGFLQKKLSEEGSKDVVTTEVDWCSLNKLFSDGATKDSASFGSKHWASVYLASTPHQAAEMGLEFPGVNEVTNLSFICPMEFLYTTLLSQDM